MQTFSFEQVLTAAQMNQVEVNVRDHVHGRDGVGSTGLNFPRTAQAAGFTAQAGNNGQLYECSGTFTIDFDAAATLGAGWAITVYNTDSGDITLDPSGAETIDGDSTFAVPNGGVVCVYSDGSNLQILYGGVARALATATQSQSGSISNSSATNITLNAYSFFPMIHITTGGSETSRVVTGHSTDGADPDSPRFRLGNESGGSRSYDVDNRYLVGV